MGDCYEAIRLFKAHWALADGIGGKADKQAAAVALKQYKRHLATCETCRAGKRLVKLIET